MKFHENKNFGYKVIAMIIDMINSQNYSKISLPFVISANQKSLSEHDLKQVNKQH